MSKFSQEFLDSGWLRFFEWVEQRSGLVFSEGRRGSAMKATMQVMQREGISDIAELIQRATSDKNFFDTVVAALTIGETYFFRDGHQFDLIKQTLIPDILAHARNDRKLRCWSAGCSTGEEAYSLAVLLSEMGLERISEIVATDLSRDSIAFARKGVYREWSFRTEESARVRKYVDPIACDSEQFEIHSNLRSRVSFRVLNLLTSDPIASQHPLYPMDIVMCRNVLIYLSEAAIRQVATGIFASLRPGGYLLTGPSDPILPRPSEVSMKTASGTRIYRKSLQLVHNSTFSKTAIHSIEEDKCSQWSPRKKQNRPQSSSPTSEPSQLSSSLRTSSRIKSRAAKAGESGRVGDKSEENRVLEEIVKIANQSAKRGIDRCRQELEQHSFCPELNYLYGVLLMHEGHYSDSQAALRRTLYLEPGLAIASYALANLLMLQGDHSGAKRCLRNIVDDGKRTTNGEFDQSFECKNVQDLVHVATEQLELILKKGSR